LHIDKFLISQDLDSRGGRIEAATSIWKCLDHSPRPIHMGSACHTWQALSLFWLFPTKRWKKESWNVISLGRGATQALKRLKVGPLVGGHHQKSIGLQRMISERKVPPERSAG
jgi:hypothetical protein